MSVKRYSLTFSGALVVSQNGGMVDYEDYAALEARCADLAAENAGLKAEHELAVQYMEELRANFTMYKKFKCQSKSDVTTPATDAFLAEVRAQGVEQLATLAGNECQRYKSVNDRAGARKWKSIVILCTDFAAQLRKEAAQ